MKTKSTFLILFLNIFCLSCQNRETIVDKQKLMGYDIRLFQDTPVWELAKAVDDENLNAIIQEISSKKVDANYKEQKFGQTLLIIAIWTSKYKSTETLLKLGADPNLGDSYEGTTAIIQAANNDDPKYLKLLLKYKGNPNSAENGSPKEGNAVRETALVTAISYNDDNSLEKVKMLVDAGADINSDNLGRSLTPLDSAITLEKFDVALYLMEHGADYRNYLYKMTNGEEVRILKALRKSVLDLDSDKYQQKLKVIAYLKAQGLDYSQEPIPGYILERIKERYPDSWENYIKKY